MLADYECQSCGHVFEKYMKDSEDTPKCPECDGETKKLITANYKIKMDGAANRVAGKRLV